jgi:hypothetical protein
MAEPMIKLEAGGTAPVLSYNVPEPTSYSGRNFIALDFDRSWFRGGFPPSGADGATPGVLRAGLSRSAVAAELSTLLGTLRVPMEGGRELGTVEMAVLAPELARSSPQDIAAVSESGQALTLVRSMSGSLMLRALPRLKLKDIDDPGNEPLPTTQLDVRITSPRQGDVVSGPAGGVTLKVRGSADVVAGVGSIKGVEVKIGSGEFKAAQPSAPGNFASWSLSQKVTASGSLTIAARATHSGGVLTKQRSVTVKVKLSTQQPGPDATPPDLTITTPESDSTVVLGGDGTASVQVSGSAADSDSGVSQVQVSLDGVVVQATPKAPNEWSTWTATAMIKAAGVHTVGVRATDKAGNIAQRNLVLRAVTQQPPVPVLERLLLVEEMRMSSFLGAYGAGRTIKTFSLLPGERTKISVKTYLRTETDAKRASSILDSFTEESATDFQTTMENEQSSKNLVEESFNYKVGGEAKAGWGWGSAKISSEVSGGTNASREELAKNIATSTQKHAAKSSSKRDVQVNTSFEVKEETGEETSIEREIENINLSRTLNFVFRQMNQEFISLLHLVDVRIGYFRVDEIAGQADPVTTYREVTLSQLDGLLDEVIVLERRQDVRDAILHQLEHVFDYQDHHHTFVETKTFADDAGNEIPNAGYLRVPKELVSTYQDPTTGTSIDVPGVILAAEKNVLRTDAVIVEALLGQGEALDDYARRLQEIEVDRREADGSRSVAEAERAELVNQVVRDNDTERAKLLADLIYPAEPSKPALHVTLEKRDDQEP